WEEDGLGGTVSRERGTDGPHLPVLTSWLVREAESGETLLSAGGFELQQEGVVVALSLRRENSALVGFLVLALPRRLPAQVELALAEVSDELALALANRPAREGQYEDRKSTRLNSSHEWIWYAVLCSSKNT